MTVDEPKHKTKAMGAGAAKAPAEGAPRSVLVPDIVLPRLHATSRRQALQLMVEAAAEVAPLDPRVALDAALLRERLSGTGVGEGVAIPHARLEGLASLVTVFARLEPPVDFGALDGLPADLALLLLTPADHGADHLKALAGASRLLRKADVRERLREARGVDGLIAVFEAGGEG